MGSAPCALKGLKLEWNFRVHGPVNRVSLAPGAFRKVAEVTVMQGIPKKSASSYLETSKEELELRSVCTAWPDGLKLLVI